MPLDRATITVASATMLPTYAIVNVAFGIVFILDPGKRLGLAPSLDFARAIVPLAVLGLLWLALAAVVAEAWRTGHRYRCMQALAINAAAWGLWGCVLEIAVFTQPNVTYLVGALPVAWAVANIASIRSLRHGEA